MYWLHKYNNTNTYAQKVNIKLKGKVMNPCNNAGLPDELNHQIFPWCVVGVVSSNRSYIDTCKNKESIITYLYHNMQGHIFPRKHYMKHHETVTYIKVFCKTLLLQSASTVKPMQCVAWKDLYFSSIDELYVDRMFRLPKCKVDKLGEADICKVW